MRITVVGLGSMGRAFAARALEKGHEVTVWNRSSGRAGELVAAGAVEAPTLAAAAARADVVIVVVSDDAAVRGVCLGPEGLLAALPAHTVLANVSTSSPALARELAEAAPDGRFLDSPVMGAPATIRKGQGHFMVGGPAETVTRLAPLWRDLGADFLHAGPVGSGLALKLVQNMLLVIGVTALAEGVAVARAQGISDDLLRTLFANSPVISPADRVRLESLLSDDHPGWFTPELARKDVGLAVSLAEQTQVPVRLGPTVIELLTSVIDTGQRWDDFTAVIEALRDKA
jgi:3-hydroxyisobutyrate dehydrogenase-like beta-hydroxyacid dehydrogenase